MVQTQIILGIVFFKKGPEIVESSQGSIKMVKAKKK